MKGLYPWAFTWTSHGDIAVDFNRAQARNIGVRWASQTKCDVIVICDADSYTERTPLREAIEEAYEDKKVHFPFTMVHQLDRVGRVTHAYRSSGGCWVTRPDVWQELGGMDERGGWSVDDRSFLEVMKTFGAGPVHHPGFLTCLWHATGGRKATPESTTIIGDYLVRSGNPEKMRRYINLRELLSVDIEMGPAE